MDMASARDVARLYVTASPYWIGLRSGEWEPRPGKQNEPS